MSRNNHSLRLSLLSSILAGVALLCAVPLSAQPASYTYIDQKAPYQNGGFNFPSPMLAALNLPKIGTTFQVQVPCNYTYSMCVGLFGCSSYVTISANHVLAIGVKNPNLAIRMLGGLVYSSAEVVVAAPYALTVQGFAKMSFPIPNSPQLVGVRFYQQVLGVLRAGSAPPQYALSRGGYGVIGR